MERDDLHREIYRTQGKLTSCFGYDAMGRKSWQFASKLPGEKLSQIHNPGDNSLLVDHAYNPVHRRYEYDPAGELTRTLDKLRGEIKYQYEANGQLHSRDTGNLVDSEEFRYDAAANRLNFNTSQFDHVKDNRLKRWRDQEYTYDAWGNLIEKRSGLSKLQTFSYDCENRLVKAQTLVNGKLHSIGTYRYDSLGRRIAKTSEINGQTEHKNFLWQGLRLLREETPGQSSLYIYEPGSYAPLARVDQQEGEAEQKLYYFHTDQIGTPLEMTDVDGSIVWQATYKAWGEVESQVPYSPVTKAQRANLKTKLESRTLTRDEYKRLDWGRRFSNKRAKGVSRFWADERAKLKLGESGTRSWSPEQKADILANKTPKYNGESIQGHHKYNALDHPQLASDPKNIYPATRTEHFERWHGGNWRNDSFGEPVNFNYPEEF